MKKTVFWTLAAVLTLAGGLFAYKLAYAGGGRTNCPGKIICPITGEEICKDQCPLQATTEPTNSLPPCCSGSR